jgi:hypothetical protein
LIPSDSEGGEATKRLIDRACSERAWLTLYQHRVDAAVSIQGRKGKYLAGETLDPTFLTFSTSFFLSFPSLDILFFVLV